LLFPPKKRRGRRVHLVEFSGEASEQTPVKGDGLQSRSINACGNQLIKKKNTFFVFFFWILDQVFNETLALTSALIQDAKSLQRNVARLAFSSTSPILPTGITSWSRFYEASFRAKNFFDKRILDKS
jgi:hypothetical protein